MSKTKKATRVAAAREHIAAVKHDHRFKYEHYSEATAALPYQPPAGFIVMFRQGCIFINNRRNKKVRYRNPKTK